jgi:hypothetical protein
MKHDCALGEAVPRPGDPTTFDDALGFLCRSSRWLA